ncbi:Lectin receptor kinase [Quillaja saponaria]|uniref:Lectin receptor kinase n=1 Tax=Quillaja saponaria TaxID=32244 RepID=A0AAD7P674_QUISA|nr:Lectin receptor kinase [Quillaja saponaria]
MSVVSMIFIFFLFLLNNVNSLSIKFRRFHPQLDGISFQGDAYSSNGVLQLTKNQLDAPIGGSVGRASYDEAVHFWDAKTGEVTDFITEFSFVVKALNNSSLFGDGFSFFFAPIDSKIPKNSSGGFLGLFSPEYAFEPSKNEIVAVEFDTYSNAWDPIFPHIGVNLNSIRSLGYVQLESDFKKGSVGHALISYNSDSKFFTVSVTYDNIPNFTSEISYIIDLRKFLPEWVRIGFSGATESLSFEFSTFQPNSNSIIFQGDAFTSNGVLQLTKNQLDSPIDHSVGRASYKERIHLWSSKTGKLADFTTKFSFTVKSVNSSVLLGDGFAFFIAPFESYIPHNSTGGLLGLFSPETALDISKNNIVAVEFDTYSNAWDPVLPHVGVDVNSINSIGYVEVAARHINKGFTAKASISYYSTIKLLEVLVTVPDQKPPYSVTYKLAYVIDLRFLPEWVRIGFSGATGQLVETNNISSWSFRSSL